MFKPTAAKTPEEYLDLIEDSEQKAEVKQVDQLIKKTVPSLKPFIISGIIGYGAYAYKSKAGKGGDWATILLAAGKDSISVHLCVMDGDKYLAETWKDKFPKANIGKSCIRFKKLAEIDLNALEKIIKKSEISTKVGQE